MENTQKLSWKETQRVLGVSQKTQIYANPGTRKSRKPMSRRDRIRAGFINRKGESLVGPLERLF